MLIKSRLRRRIEKRIADLTKENIRPAKERMNEKPTAPEKKYFKSWVQSQDNNRVINELTKILKK